MKRRSRELSLEEKKLLNTKVTDEEAMEQFIRSCRLKNLRAATIKYYSNEIFSFKKAMEEMQLNKSLVDLNQQEIEQVILFLKDKIKIVSLNTRIRAIKSFFNFLYKEKIISKNPVENISQLRDRQRIIETLENKEIEHIAKVITKQNSFVGIRDLAIFVLMLDTGVRLSELVGIKVQDIKGNKLIVRETKNLSERTVYPSRKAWEKINAYLKLRGELETDYLFVNVDNGQLKGRSIQNRFSKYQKEANITKQFSPHILRHTYAKRSIVQGMDAFSLASLLGHSDLTVTKKYVRLWGSDLEVKAKKFSSITNLKL